MMQKLLAPLLLVFACLTTGFWKDFSSAVIENTPYAEQRQNNAFNQIPLDQIRLQLDQTLDIKNPIKFSNTILKNDFLNQRLTEVLYPRQIDESSKHELVLSEKEFLRGPPAPLPPSQILKESLSFSLFHFILCTFLFLGVGFLIEFAVRKKTSLSQSILFSAVACGTLGSFFTWLQLPWTHIFFTTLGVLGLGLKIKNYKQIKFNQNELLVLGIAFFLTFLMKAFYPITLWDGRSIWFFHTKQFFYQGMLSLNDLKDKAAYFAHPSYPLLIPSNFSFFSFLEPVYNERMASLGIVVIYSGLLGCFFELLAKRISFVNAALITATVFLHSSHMVIGGYVDSYVAVCLSSLFLALFFNGDLLISFFLIAAASLIKIEGGIFAFLILSTSVTLNFFRNKPFSKKILYLYLALAPAFFHQLWLRIVDIHDYTAKMSLIDALLVFPSKLHVLWAGFTNILLSNLPFIKQSSYTLSGSATVAAVFCLIIYVLKFKREQKNFFILSIVFIILFASFLSLAAMPDDVSWLAQVTLDRVLLHFAFISFTLPFLI